MRGTVTEIGMRYTRVTTNDDVDVLVPNSEFINGRVTNWTFNERSRRIGVPFGVAYGSDKNQVREAALAAAKAVKGLIIDEHAPGRRAAAQASATAASISSCGCGSAPSSSRGPGGTASRVLWALEDELTKRGIEIPFPQRDLHVRSGTLKVSMESAADDDARAQRPDPELSGAASAQGARA